MGAYACLNFSNEIGASQSYCFSPQFSIDPAKVPFEKRWTEDAERISFNQDHGGMNISRGTKHFIFFDPDNPDMLHANLFQSDEIFRVPLRYSGHFSLNTLKSIQLLHAFIESICEDTFEPLDFLRQYNGLVRRSPSRPVAIAEKNVGKISRVWRTLEAFNASNPNDPVLFEKMGLFLLLSKLPRESEGLLSVTPDLANRPYALSLLARAHLANGDETRARKLAMDAGQMVGFNHPYLAPLLRILDVERFSYPTDLGAH